MKKYCIIALLFCCCICIQASNRWHITKDGSIEWTIADKATHHDHVEMSGQQISSIISYGVNQDQTFYCSRHIVWPMLRTIPNDTHASFQRDFDLSPLQLISVCGSHPETEQVQKIKMKGILSVNSLLRIGKLKVGLERTLFPSTTQPVYCEKYVLTNFSDKNITLEVPASTLTTQTNAKEGVDGSYRLVQQISGIKGQILKPSESATFTLTIGGYKDNQTAQSIYIDQELAARQSLIAQFEQSLVLDTPDSTINTMFAFAKIRACESIYKTKCGFMHSPGGGSYYAAIWANDQAEYIGPFFPYMGYPIGNEAGLNTYLLFARYMNPQYKKLPSSIIAEGTDIWDGAGDRGDAAMIGYGAARYALARGDKAVAEKLWPLIEWCIEYCNRKLNAQGVVASDADELEHRFPSGKANLCTSSLYYDALRSAASLGKDLHKSGALLKQYTQRAEALRKNIDRYFGGKVEGFDTYRYYEGNQVLRSWICIPLTMGIYDRKAETIKALFSPKLWTENGLLTQSGTNTYWDRSTLYALRGVLACGETEKGMAYLESYSQKRLLGEHVPYAVEAWPEGNQRHLSAESSLYCRIITEGLFGTRPTGLNSFSCTPRLPQTWDYMNLKNIKAFGHVFDLCVKRKNNKLNLSVVSNGKTLQNYTINEGKSVQIKLK